MTDERVGVFRREKGRAAAPARFGARSGLGASPSSGGSPSTRLRSRSRPRSRSRAGIRAGIARSFGYLLFGAVGFLAGTARLFGAYSPFGTVAVGAAAACCECDVGRVMPAVAGALVGSAFAGGPAAVVSLSISCAVFLALPERIRKWTAPSAGLCVFLASGVGAVLAEALVGRGIYIPAAALCEAAIAGAAAAVIVPAAQTLQGPGGALSLPSRIDIASLLLAAGVACVGLERMSSAGVSLGAILAFYVSALSGAIAGPGAGAIAGGVVGLALSTTGEMHAVTAGATAAAGAAAGIVGGRGRAFAALAIPLAAMIIGRQLGTGIELTRFLIEACMAAIALMATPSRWLAEVAWRLPFEANASGRWDECRSRVHHLVSERLLGVAGALRDLSCAYGGAQPAVHSGSGVDCADGGPQDIASSVAAVRDRVCSGCASYRLCWEELFFRTHREIVDALAVVELYGEVSASALPQGIGGKCPRRETLAKAVSQVGRPEQVTDVSQQADQPSSVSRDAAATVLSMQSAGIAQALTRAAMQAQSAVAADEALERQIRARLGRAGIEAKCVALSHTGYGGLEVQVIQAACDRARECAAEVASIVSGVLGRSMSVWGGQTCRRATRADGGATDCIVRLRSACRYTLETEALSSPGLEGDVSGDSYSLCELADGKVALLMSDGMGMGRAASEQSAAALSGAARLLEAGLDAAFAVESVNAAMSLRRSLEPFATIDAVVVDLHTGDADLIKAGAPPCYIRRGSRVTAVGAPSVPAGIAIPARTASFHVALEEGDIIVMATDGVTEGRSDLADVDAELARVIQQAPGGCPYSVAQAVMNWARSAAPARGGAGQKPFRDDITVFAARLASTAAGIDGRIVETSIPEGEADGP